MHKVITNPDGFEKDDRVKTVEDGILAVEDTPWGNSCLGYT